MHLAVSGIERDDGSTPAVHSQLGNCLYIQVERELQIFARHCLFKAETFPLPTPVVDDYLTLSIDSHEMAVVLPFKALFADDIALFVVDELRCIQFVFADFTDVPDDVSSEALSGIKPLLGVDQLHLRKRPGVAMRFYEGEFGLRQLFLDNDRLISGPLAKAFQAFDQLFIIEIESVRDGLEVLFFEVLARQNEAECGVIIDDDASVPVRESYRAARE